MGTYCGLTPGRYLHEGDSVSGDGNLGACMSLTAHRGAHELPGTVSSANDASASLAQCRDNAGQDKKPVQDADSDLSLPDKGGDACLFSVPNVEYDMLTCKNMSSRVNSSFLHWNVNGCFLKHKTQSSSHMCVLLTLYVLLKHLLKTFSLMYFMDTTCIASQPSNSQDRAGILVV